MQKSEKNLDKLLKEWASKWRAERCLKTSVWNFISPGIDYLGATNDPKANISEAHKLSISFTQWIHDSSSELVPTRHNLSVDTKITTNDTDADTNEIYEKEIQTKKSSIFIKSNRLNFSGCIQIQLKVPNGIPGADSGLSLGVDGNQSFSNETSVTRETFSIQHYSYPYVCKRRSITTLRCFQIESQTTLRFTREIIINGFIVIKLFEEVVYKGNRQRNWAIPIVDVFTDMKRYSANDLSLKQLLEGFSVVGNSVHFTEETLHKDIQSEVNFETSYKPLDVVRFSPREIKSAVMLLYKDSLVFPRMFYPQNPILMNDTQFISLSIVNHSTHQDHVMKLVAQAETEEEKDESNDLIEHFYGLEGNTILPDTIFNAGYQKDRDNEARRILVTGTAGVGKTSLTQYLLYLLANDRFKNGGSRYEWGCLVVFRNLQNMTSDSNPCDAIDLLLKGLHMMWRKKNQPELNDSELELLKSGLKEDMSKGKVLLILDGYDEITEPIPEFLFQALNELLHYDHVVITSRPYAVHSLISEEKGCFGFKTTCRLEVTGFSNESISQYIKTFYTTPPITNEGDKITLIQSFLDQNPAVKGSCRVPINLELVCTIWQRHPFNSKFLSMTKLYNRVTHFLCVRYLTRHCDLTATESFKLSEEHILRKCVRPLGVLEYFGFCSLYYKKLFLRFDDEVLSHSVDEYIYSNGDLTEPGDLLLEQSKFGFINSTDSNGAFNGISSHYFHHLTFRDYFAARFLVSCLQAEVHLEDKAFYRRNSYFDAHRWMGSQDSVSEYIRKNKYKNSFTMTLWLLVGQLSSIADNRSLEHVFEILLDEGGGSHFGINSINLLVRSVDEAEYSMAKLLPPVLVDKIYDAIGRWIITSINNNYLFPSVEESRRVWHAFKLSPWLVHQERFIKVLTSLTREICVNRTRFFAFIEFLDLCEEKRKIVYKTLVQHNFVQHKINYVANDPILEIGEITNKDIDLALNTLPFIDFIQKFDCLKRMLALTGIKKVISKFFLSVRIVFTQIYSFLQYLSTLQKVEHIRQFRELGDSIEGFYSELTDFIRMGLEKSTEEFRVNSITCLCEITAARVSLFNEYYFFDHRTYDLQFAIASKMLLQKAVSEEQLFFAAIFRQLSTLSCLPRLPCHYYGTLTTRTAVPSNEHKPTPVVHLLKSLLNEPSEENRVEVLRLTISFLVKVFSLLYFIGAGGRTIICQGLDARVFMERRIPGQSLDRCMRNLLTDSDLVWAFDLMTTVVMDTSLPILQRDALSACGKFVGISLMLDVNPGTSDVVARSIHILQRFAETCYSLDSKLMLVDAILEVMVCAFGRHEIHYCGRFEYHSVHSASLYKEIFLSESCKSILSLVPVSQSSDPLSCEFIVKRFSVILWAAVFCGGSTRKDCVAICQAYITAFSPICDVQQDLLIPNTVLLDHYILLTTVVARNGLAIGRKLNFKFQDGDPSMYHTTSLFRYLLLEFVKDFAHLYKYKHISSLCLYELWDENTYDLLDPGYLLSPDGITALQKEFFEIFQTLSEEETVDWESDVIMGRSFLMEVVEYLLPSLSSLGGMRIEKFPSLFECDMSIILKFLEKTSIDILWNYYFKIDSDCDKARQNLFTTLVVRFVSEGGAFFIEGNCLYYSRDSEYQGLPFNEEWNERIREDLMQAMINLEIPLLSRNNKSLERPKPANTDQKNNELMKVRSERDNVVTENIMLKEQLEEMKKSLDDIKQKLNRENAPQMHHVESVELPMQVNKDVPDRESIEFQPKRINAEVNNRARSDSTKYRIRFGLP